MIRSVQSLAVLLALSTLAACGERGAQYTGYVEADCIFDSGAADKLLVVASHDAPPPESWFVGRRPMDVERYRRAEPKQG